MPPLALPYATPAEYLAAERKAAEKSEYINGHVYAMAGASRVHNLIVVNTVSELRTQLRGRRCEAYANDMRVKVERTGMYTYPDVIGLCEEPRFEDENVDTLLNPTVIIEVLSPSTERYDRGEKFAHYRRLESLREYILIAQDIRRIDHYLRDGDTWVLTEVSEPESALVISSLSCTLRLSDIYDRVELSAVGSPPRA
ncbi:Uma2 family endonuclease [Longimicrobium sp.]|uniref:Uma2 family endonuclease n=1 Tax=Longimicrobium sp. TaxID=2029185 RepID=UPI003B3AC78E